MDELKNTKNIISTITKIRKNYIHKNNGRKPQYLIMGQVAYFELVEQFNSILGFLIWHTPDLAEYSDMKIVIPKDHHLKNLIDVV